MKKLSVAIVLFFIGFTSIAQVGIGTQTPNASAALEIKDSTKGILIPRLTMLKRNAIANPAEGLMVYQTDNTKGYWYFDGSTWKNLSPGSSSAAGGKATIVLSDDITNAQALAKIAAEYGSYTQEIRIAGCTNLTTIDLSMINNLIDITITDNAVLQSVNLSGLVTCSGGDNGIWIENCPQLTMLTLSSLQKVIGTDSKAGISIENTKLPGLSFPALIKASGLYIKDNTSLTTLSLPLLSNTGSLHIGNNAMTSLSFPALTTIGNLSSYNDLSIYENPNLTSISFNNLTSITNTSQSFQFSNNKLPSAQINYLLNKFVSINPPISNDYFYFTQLSPAPPTGQGITDKATLESRGNTVTTD